VNVPTISFSETNRVGTMTFGIWFCSFLYGTGSVWFLAILGSGSVRSHVVLKRH